MHLGRLAFITSYTTMVAVHCDAPFLDFYTVKCAPLQSLTHYNDGGRDLVMVRIYTQSCYVVLSYALLCNPSSVHIKPSYNWLNMMQA